MDNDRRKEIASELFEKTQMTKEQYKVFCKLAEEMDLHLVTDWGEIEKSASE